MNIAVTVALLPALFTTDGDESPSVTTVLISAPAASRPDARPLPPEPEPLPAPTTAAAPAPQAASVEAPTTTSPPTTAAHRHEPAPTTTSPPTTAAHRHEPAPTTTTTAPHRHAPAPEGRSESGRATWYELEGARAGICAHKTLPFGTIVTVTNTNTGGSIQCEVGDRGPFVDGYIIDLFRTDFEQLAPTSSGWFPAKITW